MTDQNHYIIVANGDFLVKEIINEAIQNKIIIALDEAADKLDRLHIKPHIILGDLDSFHSERLQYWGILQASEGLSDDATSYLGNHDVTIVPQQNQNLTDLIKAIHYCDKHHAASISIICWQGDRLDHQEAALRALRTEYKKNRPMILHTEQQSVCFAKNETVVLKGEIGDKCGILAFLEGSFSSQGLLFEGDNYPLIFGTSESIANSLRAKEATLRVTGEALIIMPPLFLAQRKFMQKSIRERLEMQLRDAKSLAKNEQSHIT